MENKRDTAVGKMVYIYFEGKRLKRLKKKARPKKAAIIIPAFILENKGKQKPKIVAVCTKKIFYSDAPYGGKGIKLDAADTCIITQDELNCIKDYDEEKLIDYCTLNGFDYDKFKVALKAYRPKSKAKKK